MNYSEDGIFFKAHKCLANKYSINVFTMKEGMIELSDGSIVFCI